MAAEAKHTFSVHSFASPEPHCDYCDEQLSGLFNQGVKCAGCGMNLHAKCIVHIVNPCVGAKKASNSPSPSRRSASSRSPKSSSSRRPKLASGVGFSSRGLASDAATEFERLHNAVRCREKEAGKRWESVTQPLLRERKKMLSKEHKVLLATRKSKTKEARRLSKARYNRYRVFLIDFYSRVNPEKSQTEIDALLSHYVKVEAPKRLHVLLNKLKQSYPGIGEQLVVGQEISHPVNDDGLEELIDELSRLEHRIEQSIVRREEVERELLFPSLASEGVGIAPKWRARMGFEGMYAAIGDLTIDEASGGTHLYVAIPSLHESKSSAKRRPVVKLVVDGGDTGNDGLLTALQLDNFSSNGKALPMGYSADHLNIETEIVLQFEAEHVDIRSPIRPHGFWKMVPGSFKCDILKLRNRIKGATLPVPELVLTTITSVVLSYILKRVGLEMLPPELGVYLKKMWKRDKEIEAEDEDIVAEELLKSPNQRHRKKSNANDEGTRPHGRRQGGRRARAQTSPESWSPMDIQISFKMSNRAKLSYSKSGQDLIDVFGLSEEEAESLLRAQNFLGVRRKRLFSRSVKERESVSAHAHTSSHVLRNGRDWIRYYQKYLRGSLPEEREKIIALWNEATTGGGRSSDVPNSSLRAWPTSFPFFQRFLNRLEEIDRKPMKFETSTPKMDVKLEAEGITKIFTLMIKRLVHVSPAFEISSAGMHAPVQESGSTVAIPVLSGKYRKTLAPGRIGELVDGAGDSLVQVIHTMRKHLVHSMTVGGVNMVAAGGEFQGSMREIELVSPVDVNLAIDGRWISSMFQGSSSPEWPWRHELRSAAKESGCFWWGMTRNKPLIERDDDPNTDDDDDDRVENDSTSRRNLHEHLASGLRYDARRFDIGRGRVVPGEKQRRQKNHVPQIRQTNRDVGRLLYRRRRLRTWESPSPALDGRSGGAARPSLRSPRHHDGPRTALRLAVPRRRRGAMGPRLAPLENGPFSRKRRLYDLVVHVDVGAPRRGPGPFCPYAADRRGSVARNVRAVQRVAHFGD